MANIPVEIIKAARPIHWTKNFALFAAIVFSGNLFDIIHIKEVIIAFVSFSLASSATYVFNDLLDADRDALHPIKKHRPIASGKLNKRLALQVSLVLAVASLIVAAMVNNLFIITVFAYLLLQISYSLKLKHLAIVDILVIATGFILRVYAGAVAINAHLSVWFLLCVISVSLFLASGKRRAELGIVTKIKVNTRISLSKYSKPLLDSYVTMFGNAAWMSWSMFAFFESPPVSVPVWLFLAEISKTTAVSKLLMLTIPVAIFGIMRYEKLIFEDRSESPEKLFLTDIPLVASIILWVFIVVVVLYFTSGQITPSTITVF